jgi:hypothetical protein
MRKHALIESETRIELLTRNFQVVHIQISGDEFESTMDGREAEERI